jgi:hypothetical protein
MAVVINGTTGIDKVQDGSIGTADIAADAITTPKIANSVNLGRRNLIINGAMQVAQRGTSNTSVSDGNLLADRFVMRTSNNGWYRADQDSSAPAGFPYSLKITSLGANTPASGAYIFLSQKIEGFNSFQLSYGTSSAKTITVSFYVRSSITGTHGGSLRNNAQNRSYPFSYTISSADTWEYKTITISGDTTGTWVGATNGIGLEVIWNLGSGSANIGTTGSWASAGNLGATGEVNIVETSGATLYITGVQLEVGDTATPFEHRSYGEELALCQRYYSTVRFPSYSTFATGQFTYNPSTSMGTTLLAQTPGWQMRATPTMTTTESVGSFYSKSTGGTTKTLTGLILRAYSGGGTVQLQASSASSFANDDQNLNVSASGATFQFDAEI